MKSKWVWVIFVLLFFLHQDVWFWNDQSLVFDFMPIGLAYHAAFSISAALLWVSAVKWAWPSDIEAWADEPTDGNEA